MRRGAGRRRGRVESRGAGTRNARRFLALLAVPVVLVTVGGASLATRTASAQSGLFQGFAMQAGQPPTEYQRIAHTGANMVYFDVYWEADSPDANSVHRFSGTKTDAVLIGDIQNARAAGLSVTLMPKVWCNGCQDNWRGFLTPSDPHAFMQSYQEMDTYYADLAQQRGVSLFFLGSEMNNLQQYGDDWRQLATAVRQVFNGPITYQPNWDRVDSVAFWDALDFDSVSAYFPLTTTPSPTVAQLKQAWQSSNVPGWEGQNWFAGIQNLAKATGKSVLIGEVGYRSSTTATAHPWEEAEQQTPDQATQANAYQALLEMFSPQSWWKGVIWWQWRGPDPDANSTDMSPKGKQAEQLLTEWWAEGWRPTPESPTPKDLGGGGGSAPGHVSAAVAHTPNSAARPQTTAGSTSTSGSTTTQQTAPAPVDSGGLVGGDSSSAALGPKSATTGHSSGSRDVLVGVALVGLLGMGGALVNLARIRLRTPGPLV
jgi:hypothetical protein